MTSHYAGQTALITGASAGIGVEFAQAFAALGANLVLVARRKERLEELAKNIETSHGVKVTVIAQDLSTPDAGEKLLSTLSKKKLGIDVLVNNAGFGTHNRVVNEDRARVRDEITLNVTTLTDLTIGVLPSMVANDRGTIINVASTASYQPVPGMAVYAATKAFVRSFTEALWGELGNSAVRVIALSPGATATEFFDIAGASPSSTLVAPEGVVQTVMKELEKSSPKPTVIDGARNAVMAKATRFLPSKAVIKTAGKLFLPKD